MLSLAVFMSPSYKIISLLTIKVFKQVFSRFQVRFQKLLSPTFEQLHVQETQRWFWRKLWTGTLGMRLSSSVEWVLKVLDQWKKLLLWKLCTIHTSISGPPWGTQISAWIGSHGGRWGLTQIGLWTFISWWDPLALDSAGHLERKIIKHKCYEMKISWILSLVGT